MPQKTIFLTLEQVLVIHEDQVVRYGGTSGLRDLTLLESAIFRPQSSFGGEDLYSTVFVKAAALAHSLILNHPFIDGNKRTGVVSSLVFLEINGYSLDVTQDQLVEMALKIATKVFDIEEIADWIKRNSKKVK
jgi:death-on-curing protein